MLRRAIAAEGQLAEAQKTITDKDAEIIKQTDLKFETYRANAEWQEQYEKSQRQVVKLQKALKEAYDRMCNNLPLAVRFILVDALKVIKEEVES
ncbi:hypothetical protein [Paenibacillus glacialis]|uniref:Uncharacterized protein n=1 Tax=Paenibacillus glacialis TaxID=494026 RepID=A0A168MCI6_9BACL|nr:hypothetical protein [Paenibacillus glacialis]OAB44510.1 hypothetical protein PGLA_07600 [Paenibacillus glacialis]